MWTISMDTKRWGESHPFLFCDDSGCLMDDVREGSFFLIRNGLRQFYIGVTAGFPFFIIDNNIHSINKPRLRV